MYIPKEFEVKDVSEIITFLLKNTFGTIISTEKGRIEATHLPFVIKRSNETIVLEAHIALANSQHVLLKDLSNALVIFQGEHGYISSSVYGHDNVPTWNYKAVHLKGNVERLSDTELLSHLKELVESNEATRENPLLFSNLNQELVREYARDIVGFRFTSSEIQASFKLSQNRNSEDFNAILKDLNQCPHLQNLASEMKKTRD